MRGRLAVAVMVLALAGCAPKVPAPGPATTVEPGSVAETLLHRPPIAQVPTKDLPARIAEDSGVAKIALADKAAAEEELRERQLAKWRSRLFWGGVILAVLAVAAFFLILKLAGSVKWAWRAAAALASLAVLCPLVGWILGHVTLTLVVLALIVGAGVAVKLLGKWKAMVDALKVMASTASANIKDFDAALAKAEVHNVESFEPILAELKETPKP